MSKINIALVAILVLLVYTLVNVRIQSRLNDRISELESELEIKDRTIDSLVFDWDLFKMAIKTIESNNNPNAVNPVTNATGLYQILRSGGYLDYYNQFNDQAYEVDDLFIPEVQEIIFDFVQDKRNPTHDPIRALYLHNPKASMLYAQKVYKEYNNLKYNKFN